MTTININNFLKWTSIAISIDNPNLNKSSCMKIALKELQKEKIMRNYIRVYSMKLQKENSIISKKDSIIQALTEWKKM
jgi:hypothetical protein|tara:strand:+ start:2169 stop:2402 length:234 start_codon:yes stop_codon:yes gene_type:complete